MAEIINLEEEVLKRTGVKALIIIERKWGAEIIDSGVDKKTIISAAIDMYVRYPDAMHTTIEIIRRKEGNYD